MTLQRNEPFREFLYNELLTRTQKNARFSLRAFANQLDIEPSALSQILRGGPHEIHRLRSAQTEPRSYGVNPYGNSGLQKTDWHELSLQKNGIPRLLTCQ